MAPRRRLRHDEYTVGWVCALPLELTAATAMLDEEHADLPCDPADTNLYTLGRMGAHNVVIACLPAGQTGNNSAATVATQMRLRFPALRFGLMVGVGGGVPTMNTAGAGGDVRLGDVVVSQPSMGHGGVVQYDFGKSTPSGFVQTGLLSKPPDILLNAIAKLQARYQCGYMKSHRLGVSALNGEQEFLGDVPGPDLLFEATYKHVDGATCEKCDRSQLVERPTRGEKAFRVHYGTIASGNQVIRDGVVRDEWSSKLGGVLCFEMEAAGLMNSFPCLVVRGICDYADSHKNKEWQPFAARTAAAFASEVLTFVPASSAKTTGSTDTAGLSSDDPAVFQALAKREEWQVAGGKSRFHFILTNLPGLFASAFQFVSKRRK
jgi:nucleoside phosphorylase